MGKKVKYVLIRLSWIAGVFYTLPVVPIIGLLMLVLTLPMLTLTAL